MYYDIHHILQKVCDIQSSISAQRDSAELACESSVTEKTLPQVHVSV